MSGAVATALEWYCSTLQGDQSYFSELIFTSLGHSFHKRWKALFPSFVEINAGNKD